MTIETRLKKLEDKVRASAPDKEWLHIFINSNETRAEAVARYEKEHGITYSEDKYDLVLISWLRTKRDLAKKAE